MRKRKEKALQAVNPGRPYLDETFGSVQNLLRFMDRENIPLTAQIIYMGCGTHTVGLEWIEETEEPFYYERYCDEATDSSHSSANGLNL